MKRRAHVLHQKLAPVVDRKDLSLLSSMLKPKREFVLVLKMSETQSFLYRNFLARLKTVGSMTLFTAYQGIYVCVC